MMTKLKERMIYPTHLKNIRQKKRITLDTLSKISGISISYLSAIENGQRNVNLNKLKQICDALEIPFEAIIILSSDSQNPIVRDKLKPVIKDIIYELYGDEK